MFARPAPTPGHTTSRASLAIIGIRAPGSSRWKMRTAIASALRAGVVVEPLVGRAGPAVDVDHRALDQRAALSGRPVDGLAAARDGVVDRVSVVPEGDRPRPRTERDPVHRSKPCAHPRPDHGPGAAVADHERERRPGDVGDDDLTWRPAHRPWSTGSVSSYS